MPRILATGLGVALVSAVIPLPDHLQAKRIQLSLAIIVTAVAVAIISFIVTEARHAWRAKQLGCKPAKVRPYKWPGAVDLIWRMIQADKRGEVPEEFMKVCDEMVAPTFKQSILGTPSYFTIEPKNVQAILATQFKDFEIGEQRRNNFFPLLGNGIFTADGKSWEHSRAILRPQFVRDQVGDLDLEENHLQHMFEHLRTDAHGWTSEIDLSPLFFRLTLDSATQFLFGQSIESQIGALPDGHPAKSASGEKDEYKWHSIGRSFDRATHDLGTRARFADHYWLYSPKSFHDNCKEVHRFADTYVDLALNGPSPHDDQQVEKGKDKPRYVFLQELVKVTRDPTELRSQLLNILLAGRDTTAGLLGWTFWLLARHPAEFAKLRRRILDDFGTYQDPQNISFASLKACSYLQYVLNETLRLYPSVPVNARRAVRDTTLPVGGGPDGTAPLYVRKDWEIAYSVQAMHYRSDIWGADVREFKPERWISRKTGWEYLPFNGGPRICLGQQFALTEAGYVIVRMMQRYDQIDNLDPNVNPIHQYSVTSAPAAVKLRLHEAKG